MPDQAAQLLDRRSILFGLGGVSLSACATSAPSPLTYQEREGPFYPVQVSEDRILETVRGLRPGRTGGFRLEADLFETKTLVHNYGHGGDGVTLSWGCARLSADRVLETETTDVAVIGAGVQGLTTALLLLQAGRQVTIYAEAFTPNVTSDVAGAIILTAGRYGSVPNNMVRRVNQLARRGFEPYLNRPGYGVTEVRYHNLDCYRHGDQKPEVDTLLGCAVEQNYTTIMVDMSQYLPRLMQDIRALGGIFYTQKFESLDHVLSLEQEIIVNCSGLGAGVLCNDEAVYPLWGQLVRLQPQQEIDYAYTSRGLEGNLYMLPRETSIVLGGTRRRGETSLEPDDVDIARLLREHKKLAAYAQNWPGV